MRTMTRRSLFTSSFGAALAAGGLAACTGPAATSGSSSSGAASGSAAAVAVTYQLSWTQSVQFGGTYLAKDQGLFSKAGLDVTLAPGGPDVAGDTNTVSGKSLCNISSADGMARSNAQGADLVVIARQAQKSPGTLLSLGSAPIKTPAELKGKKIGVAGTDTPALDAFLKINGMSKSDVSFVPTQYDPAVLTAKQVDAIFCFYTDLPVALQSKGVEGYSMLLADFGYNPMSQTYSVARTSLQDADKRKQVVELFRADAQGWQLYQKDPDAAAELAVKMYPDAGLDLPTQKAQAKIQLDIMFSDVTATKGFGYFSDTDVQDNLKLFSVLGITGAKADLWDHSILDEVYAAGPTA